ncbi:4-oxalocrotonate tautomerase family protein [Chitinophaga sp. 30R24]|uniref:tautomerase family protein n=1 Tax=Chitinophaga sp. 30R24 TaxID=3248838 RepID=UPI003B8FCED1
MPYLQLEVIKHYPADTKKALAKKMGEVFSEIMHTNPMRITVSIRELGEGSIWRCSEGDPTPGALLMLDVRQGRSIAVRATLAKALIDVCTEMLSLEKHQLNIEFTQHSGDEMYHAIWGGFSDDWEPDEE